MLVSKDQTKVPFYIDAYEPGKVIINEQSYTNSVIIYPQKLDSNWQTQCVQNLQAADFQQFAACEAKLIIFGTGEKQFFPPIELYADLLTKGFMFEFMASKSACYTYNILKSENRDVIAALLL